MFGSKTNDTWKKVLKCGHLSNQYSSIKDLSPNPIGISKMNMLVVLITVLGAASSHFGDSSDICFLLEFTSSGTNFFWIYKSQWISGPRPHTICYNRMNTFSVFFLLLLLFHFLHITNIIIIKLYQNIMGEI